MASEIDFLCSLRVFKAGVLSNPKGASFGPERFTWAGSVWYEGIILVGTTATLIPLGDLTNLGMAYFRNADDTNYIRLRNGSAGADFCRLLPSGIPFIGPLDTTCVPYAIAHTAPCYMEYLVLSP